MCICVCNKCVCCPYRTQELLTNHLVQFAATERKKPDAGTSEVESYVFYQKMDGDYYRYMAEVASPSGREGEWV